MCHRSNAFPLHGISGTVLVSSSPMVVTFFSHLRITPSPGSTLTVTMLFLISMSLIIIFFFYLPYTDLSEVLYPNDKRLEFSSVS